MKAELPDGRIGVGTIGVRAPDVSDEIEWIEPRVPLVILAGRDLYELDDLPLRARYTRNGTSVEAEGLLPILPIRRQMLLSPDPSMPAEIHPSYQVGPGTTVDPGAWLHVEEEPGRCASPPLRELSQEIEWTLRPPGGATRPLVPPEPLQESGKYRVLARSTRFPRAGPSSIGSRSRSSPPVPP
ncbi:MAG: hypothetical protein JRH01_00105 [Deltaproteobacteria bacterium]|nr:hypothetical protein [Deltaproteobacteria bacterium]